RPGDHGAHRHERQRLPRHPHPLTRTDLPRRDLHRAVAKLFYARAFEGAFSMAKKKIAVIGIGKISQDQHLPVIDKSKHFELAACVSTRGVGHRDVPVFRTAAELYEKMPEVGVVSICTPPGVRHALVREAL